MANLVAGFLETGTRVEMARNLELLEGTAGSKLRRVERTRLVLDESRTISSTDLGDEKFQTRQLPF